MNLNQSWPQQPVDDLRVDMAFRENLISESLNSKFAGILPEGVYYGFDVKVKGNGSSFEVEVGSAGKNTALVEIENPDKPAVSAALTVKLPANKLKTIPVEAGVVTYIVLEVYYRAELLQDQSHKTTAVIKAVTSLSEPNHTRQLVIGTVNPPAETPALRQEHVIQSRKVDLGTEQISDSYGMPNSAGDIKFHPEDGPVETPAPYMVGFGNGALMGRFSVMDTLTGGVLEFTAFRNTKNGLARINLLSKTDDFPALKVSMSETDGRTEVYVHFYYSGASSDEIFVDLKAYDAHNEAGVGWIKAFEPMSYATSTTELASIDISNGHMGSSGVVIENGKPLADSYLGIEAKAKDSEKSDLATVAATANNAEKLGGKLANTYPSLVIPYEDKINTTSGGGTYVRPNGFPEEGTNPDTLKVPSAMIRHPNMPNSADTFHVETITYGGTLSNTQRVQKATRISSGLTAEPESVFYRWLNGNYTSPSKSAWKEMSFMDSVVAKESTAQGDAYTLAGYKFGRINHANGDFYILLCKTKDPLASITGVLKGYCASSQYNYTIDIDLHSYYRYVGTTLMRDLRNPIIKSKNFVQLKNINYGGVAYWALKVDGASLGWVDWTFSGEYAGASPYENLGLVAVNSNISEANDYLDSVDFYSAQNSTYGKQLVLPSHMDTRNLSGYRMYIEFYYHHKTLSSLRKREFVDLGRLPCAGPRFYEVFPAVSAFDGGVVKTVPFNVSGVPYKRLTNIAAAQGFEAHIHLQKTSSYTFQVSLKLSSVELDGQKISQAPKDVTLSSTDFGIGKVLFVLEDKGLVQ